MNLPKSVLVVADQRYAELRRGQHTVDLLENPVDMVLPFSGLPVAHAEAAEIVRDSLATSGRLLPGVLYIRNPYEGVAYERSDTAIEVLAEAKFHAIGSLAGLLGAREVVLEQVEVESHETSQLARLKAKILAFRGSADVRRSVKRSLERRMESTMVFDGGAPDISAAYSFLASRNLSADPQLAGLIELRSSVHPVKSYLRKFSGIRESTSNLESGLKLAGVPGLIEGGGGSFARAVSAVREVQLSTRITF